MKTLLLDRNLTTSNLLGATPHARWIVGAVLLLLALAALVLGILSVPEAAEPGALWHAAAPPAEGFDALSG